MTNYTRMTAEDGGRSPSVVIFGDMGKWRSRQDRGLSIVVGSDFGDAPFCTTGSQAGPVYSVFEGTVGGKLTADDIGEELGVLSMVTAGTDNMENYVQIGHANSFRIDHTSGNTGTVRFEARVATNTVADNGAALFVGLGTGPVAANYLVDDTGELISSKGFVGFQRLQDDGDKMDIVYQAAGQTKQTVVANAVSLTADSYVNLGFIADTSGIRFYVDGVKQSATVTTSDIAAATFPEGEALAPVLLQKNGSATATSVFCDWVWAVQDADA